MLTDCDILLQELIYYLCRQSNVLHGLYWFECEQPHMKVLIGSS